MRPGVPVSSRGLIEEIGLLLRLGGPLALVQFGMTALGFVDVAFLGHYEASALPAMALGNTLVWACMVFCLGCATAVGPLLSQSVGAGDPSAVSRTMLRGALMAVLLSLPAMALLLPAATWLEWLGQKRELIPDAALYARINSLGVLPFLWFSLPRSLLSAHSRTASQVVATALGNALNALCDYAWIQGAFGFEAAGVEGAAWATVASRWAMFAILLASSWRELRPIASSLADPPSRAAALRPRPLLRLFRLGLPIGLQFSLEMGIFALTQILIGTFDAAAAHAAEPGGPRVAGHQIAIQMASMSFMLPLGIGMAASVRVGWAVGRNDTGGARRATLAALLAGAAIMSAFMLLFLFAPERLAGTLTDRPSIRRWAAAMIPIAVVFQIGDGIQVVSVGCLRGLGDVRSPLLVNLLGFYGVALPLGCWLAWGRGMGPVGLWWGLAAGLFAVALCLAWMLRMRLAETVGRIDAS
ncbi:MAG: MATE family efflux transporter [Planctomycetota bacterium]